MKVLFFTIFFIGSYSLLHAQNKENVFLGKVSYLTPQNIYMRFDGANQVQQGDTVFIQHGETLKPLLIVESRSSLSCIGKPFPGMEVSIGEEVFVKSKQIMKQSEEKNIIPEPDAEKQINRKEKEKARELNPFKEKIKGRISVSSYSGFSSETENDYQRMRYSLSLKADHISDSRFSVDAYVNFSHRLDDWASVQDNIFNALKIYNLAFKYQASERSAVWVGRKINPNLSNIGAVDGVQFETGFNNFSIGAAVGFRPNYQDYSFNANLLEYGAYFTHGYQSKTGSVRSSLAFFEQRNQSNIDRRFIYFQHSNTLLNRLFFFASSEVDLYKLENGIPTNSVSLTSVYLSLRYKLLKQLSVYTSYDARKNVIYFETFKNLADRLLEEATRQGVQLRINYHPAKLLNIGLNGSYRKRDGDPDATKTVRGFISVNQIPGINTAVTLSGNLLQTAYLDGKIAGITIYKDLMGGKLYTSMGYRYVDYEFSSNSVMKQHIGELDLTWRISKKWSLSANYEGAFEKSALYNALYLNLVKRF